MLWQFPNSLLTTHHLSHTLDSSILHLPGKVHYLHFGTLWVSSRMASLDTKGEKQPTWLILVNLKNNNRKDSNLRTECPSFLFSTFCRVSHFLKHCERSSLMKSKLLRGKGLMILEPDILPAPDRLGIRCLS